MKKIELTDIQKVLYRSKRKEPFFVEVPTMNYLQFRGTGHPEDEDFQLACENLYTISYVIKFEIAKKLLGIDFKVSPMEVNWYIEKTEQGTAFSWKMMLMQPDFVTEEMIQRAICIAGEKGKQILIDRVEFGTIEFGRCIQCYHLGDYNRMNDTLAKMLQFGVDNNVDCDRYTHDIYLNDMRKTKVENYSTIMRIRTYPR